MKANWVQSSSFWRRYELFCICLKISKIRTECWKFQYFTQFSGHGHIYIYIWPCPENCVKIFAVDSDIYIYISESTANFILFVGMKFL